MIEQITPTDFAAWLQRASALGQPLVLDVREPAECAIASIAPQGVTPQGFALRYLPMGQVVQHLAQLDPEQPTACLCHHGGRSQQVAYFLAQQGFAHVVNIAGGIDAWAQQVDPGIARY